MATNAIVVGQNDINLMIEMYQNDNPALTRDYCLQQSSQHLESLFRSKIDESEKAFKESHEILNHENVSVQYSECIVTVEKALISTQCILSVLADRPVSDPALNQQIMHQQIMQMEQKLREMRPLQPAGETSLQMKTIELMQQITTIPTNETYKNSEGVLYYQPKVSHNSIRLFFEGYCKRGGYKSIQTASQQNRFYNIDLGGEFHLVSFLKEQSQAVYELERRKGGADVDEVKSRYQTFSLQTTITHAWGKFASLTSDRVPAYTSEKALIAEQKKILEEIRGKIQLWIEQEGWGFEHCDFLSTQEQINIGIEPKNAVMADCIVLYHRKVENH